jgi:hypothetical protein
MSPCRFALVAGVLAWLLASGAMARAAEPAVQPQAVLDAYRAASLPAAPDAASLEGTLRLSYQIKGQGLTGAGSSTTDLATGAFVDAYQLGPQEGANGFDGQTAWMRDASGAATPQAGGDKRELAVNEAYRRANMWWRADRGGAAIRALGLRHDGGRAYQVLEVTPLGGKPFQAWFDPASHLLAGVIEQQGAQLITTRYGDYRQMGALRLPAHSVSDPGLGPNAAITELVTQARFAGPQAAGAYAAPKGPFSDAVIHNPAGRVTVPFRLINNHIYAEVKVNGQGPFLFIFDTGGQTLLTPSSAAQLQLKPQGQGAGTGAGEGVVDVGFLKGVDFEIGDLELKDQAAAVLSFAAPEMEGIPEQGMMGFALFRRFVTVIDYSARTLTFIDPARFEPSEAGVAVPFVFYEHLPQVRGSFEGIPGVFDIDTGSRVELTLTKPFVEAHRLRTRRARGVTAVDGWGVGGRSISYVTRARELTLGPVKIENIVAGMATQSRGAFADANYQGNVGSGLLKRFVVTFDYERQVMYLKPQPGPVADVGVFDRSGMWINAAPDGFKVVDLTRGGAAERAGLKVGDELTAVDGRSATEVDLSDLRQRLRDPSVKSVAFTVRSGGRTRPLRLVLKDQI